jgi:DNA-binding beta-propeller fold protein YncE
MLGGREGMARSLGSVYGGSVTLFIGTAFRGAVSRVIDTPGVQSWSNGVAVSRDGCTLLVSDANGGSHAIHEFDAAVASRRRVVGSGDGSDDGPLQFAQPCQVWVAADNFVFVADRCNDRVQVLTPTLDFHGFIGDGELRDPVGVCANADVVVATESGDHHKHHVTVFRRCDGTLLARFGRKGVGDGDLGSPLGLCFVRGGRHVAVAEPDNKRVSVFSVDAGFVCHVGVGVLKRPWGVACSTFDELVVADMGGHCVRVFSDVGELLMTVGGGGNYSGVTIHGQTLFLQD